MYKCTEKVHWTCFYYTTSWLIWLLVFQIYLFIWNGSNTKNLFSDQAQAPHQDGTPRTPQLMSEPKTAGSILLLFKLFPDLKHLLEVGNQITIICNVLPFSKAGERRTPHNMALGIEHLAKVTFPQLIWILGTALHVQFCGQHFCSISIVRAGIT